jgi:hypothetical protein
MNPGPATANFSKKLFSAGIAFEMYDSRSPDEL